MIAHKRFKVIGAVLLTVVLTVGLAVPCFASLPTDDSGNFLPTSYNIAWQIYNPDTQSYDSVNITSSVTSDGLTFTFPFNSYGVRYLYMVLYAGLDSNVYIDGISFDGYASYSSSSSLISFSRPSVFTTFYLNDSGSNSSYDTYFGADNPFSYSEQFDSLRPFRLIRFGFYVSIVSGSLTIRFNSFYLGGQDITSMITVQNLDNASQDLMDLGDQLDVPKPSIQVANIVEDALDGADYQSVGSTTWSFMSNDLITKMLLITVSFALLGYILFGKKESGS